jgi:2'-5' RNA ligase
VSLDYGIDKGPEAADKAFYAVRADLQAKGQRHLKGGDRPYGLVEEEVKVAEITPEQPVHDFSSTQVNLPKAEANEILDFGKSIPDAEIYTDPNDPTVGREDKPHITVKYGIHTENAKKIKALLEGAGAVTAKLGKVDVFSPDDKPYDVVMVPVDSPELHDLNAKVAEGTKVTDTFPEYQPHVTIAYVKKGEGAKYKGDARFEGKEITFDTVHFTDKDEQATKIKLEEKPVSETKPVVPETELPKGETIEPKPGIKEPKDKTKLTVKDIPDGLKIDIWAIVEGKKVKLKGQDAKEEFTRIEAERETLDALIKCLKG